MNNTTPKGWKSFKLKEIYDIKRGGSPRPIEKFLTTESDGINWIKIGDAKIGSKYIEQTKEKITQEGATKSRFVDVGDFILSNSMSFGRPYIMKTRGCVHDGWLVLKEKQEGIVCKDFMYYMLSSSNVYSQFQNAAAGGVVSNLNIQRVENVSVLVPPTIAEQQEIVQVLDAMSEIIRLREECVQHAQDLIPALFQEMFGDIHNNKTNSQIVKLGDFVDFIRGPFGGSLKKEIFVNEGYLVYEQYHAINNDFNFARYFVDEQKYKEMQRFSVKAGDLLISCSGTMGKIAIVPDDYKKGIINQALLKLTVNPKYLNNIFLKNLLLTDYYQRNYFKDQPGVAIQNVRSVKVLKNIDIILPALSLQEQFVQKAIEIENYIKEQEEELENANQMFQSLLHHAFTGKLTENITIEVGNE